MAVGLSEYFLQSMVTAQQKNFEEIVPNPSGFYCPWSTCLSLLGFKWDITATTVQKFSTSGLQGLAPC